MLQEFPKGVETIPSTCSLCMKKQEFKTRFYILLNSQKKHEFTEKCQQNSMEKNYSSLISS